MEHWTGSKLGKDYIKAAYCYPAYLTSMQSTSCEMLGWTKHKLESRLLGEISITSDMQMTPPSGQKVKRKVKEESEKVSLKLNIQKTKIMASSPIISWQVDGETMETMTDFIFFGSKITADGDCSHEIKRHLLLGRKAMTNIGSILKSRDTDLTTKVHLVKAMVFPVVMYGCENWTIKKAECQRIELGKTLESPLDCKEIQPVHPKGNQTRIFIVRTDAEAETPILWTPDVKS